MVAARLSENPDVSVLVLEAGGEENELFYSHIPGSVAFLQKTSMDWQYFTVPQKKYGNGLNDNVVQNEMCVVFTSKIFILKFF